LGFGAWDLELFWSLELGVWSFANRFANLLYFNIEDTDHTLSRHA
jgi:hypothetical protein